MARIWNRLAPLRAVCQDSDSDQAWWEFYPQEDVQPVANLFATPGRDFTVEVNFLGNKKYSFFLENDADGDSVNFDEVATQTFNSSTVEWIVERPKVDGSFTNLSNFGTATWTTGVYNNQFLIAQTVNDQELMYDGSGHLMASVSGLDSNSGFTDTQHSCK